MLRIWDACDPLTHLTFIIKLLRPEIEIAKVFKGTTYTSLKHYKPSWTGSGKDSRNQRITVRVVPNLHFVQTTWKKISPTGSENTKSWGISRQNMLNVDYRATWTKLNELMEKRYTACSTSTYDFKVSRPLSWDEKPKSSIRRLHFIEN